MTRFSCAFLLIAVFSTLQSSAQSNDGSALFPYVLYTTVGSPSATQFEARDASGQPIAGTITFFGYDTSRISIDANGFVTGLVQDSVGYNGTKVFASVDGDTLQYAAHVRVVSQTYNFDYEELDGEHTKLYYPRSVGSEPLESLVDQYDMVELLDNAYDVEEYLFQTVPDEGAKQIVVVEPEENYDFRHCRNLDNVLRLSYSVAGGQFQNCFMVAYLPGNSPRMDVVYHEFGHAFQDEANVYMRSLDREFIYREGLADLLFTAVPQIVSEEPGLFPLSADGKTAVQAVADFKIAQQQDRYDEWIAGGAVFADLNSNIIHGIILEHREERTIEFYQRFFYVMQDEFEDDLNTVLQTTESLGALGSHTFFVALLGAVVKVDLSSTFTDSYNYTIDMDLHDAAFDKLTQILDASIFTSIDDEPTVPDLRGIAIDVYPNPTTTSATFAIKMDSPGEVGVSIYDLLGRQVLSPEVRVSSGISIDLNVDVSSLPGGMYLYRVTSGQGSDSGKLIVVN